MSFASIAPRIKDTIVRKPKPSLLPVTAKLTIPAGLDWVIRQRLTHVSAFATLGINCTSQRADDLCRLDQVLRQDGRTDIHQVTLWGYELAVLYSFLHQQEQSFTAWSATQIPPRALRTIRADLRGLLPRLRAICRKVDVYADRPIRHR